MSDHPTTFLDVEDDDQRQKRIGTLLERLNTTSLSSASPNPLDIGHQPPRGPVEPSAELLARIQAFLPAISASNEALSRQKPEDIDIEHVAEDEAQYIEMNLGLGVFEAKPRPNPNAPSPSSEAESTSDASSSSESSSESESDAQSHDSGSEDESDEYSSSDSSDDSDSEPGSGSSVDMRPISSRPIKPLPRRVSQQTKHEV